MFWRIRQRCQSANANQASPPSATAAAMTAGGSAVLLNAPPSPIPLPPEDAGCVSLGGDVPSKLATTTTGSGLFDVGCESDGTESDDEVGAADDDVDMTFAGTESDSDEDGDEFMENQQQQQQQQYQPRLACDGSAFRHNVRPAPDIPESWPVYEVYCLNVPQDALDPGAPGSEKSWGKFKATNFAGATKRLLYLLLRSVHRAIEGPAGCDPLLDLEPATAPDRLHANRKIALEMQYRNTNAQGYVERPPGIGGAFRRPEEEDPTLRPLQDMLHTIRERGEVTAQTARGGDDNVFVFCKRNRNHEHGDDEEEEEEEEEEDEPEPPQQIIVRRVSIVLEELLSEQRGETAGWRWWFLVHDPRIVLAKWMARVIRENQALEAARQQRRDRALQGVRVNMRLLRERIDNVDESGCYRGIRSPDDYAQMVRAYYAGLNGRFSGEVPIPQQDSGAVGFGMHEPTTSLHPCRVFSPQVAMSLHIRDNACMKQTILGRYIRTYGETLRYVWARPSRTTCYSALQLTPDALHRLPLPASPYRSVIINNLIWKALRLHSALLPADLEKAVTSNRADAATVSMEVWERLSMDECSQVQNIVDESLSEAQLATRELAALRNGGAVFDSDDEGGYDEGSIAAAADTPALDGDMQIGYERDFESAYRELAMETEAGAGGGVGDPFLPGMGTGSSTTSTTPLRHVGREIDAWLNTPYDPEGEVDQVLFDHMRQREETCSSLSKRDVQRSPLLHLRMCNLYARDHMQAAYVPGTPMYRSVMADFRQRSFANFWNTLETYKDDETRLSGPVRGALRLINRLNRTPNYTRRHYHAIFGDDDDGDDEPSADHNGTDAGEGTNAVAARSRRMRRSQQSSLFASAVYRQRHGPGGRQVSTRNLATSGVAGGFRVDPRKPQAGTTLWHEWPYGGGWNLSAYGSWRSTMRHRAVHLFRCRPGAGPDLLHRLLLAQGTAWEYHWGLHGDQLMWGPGGVGKSYMLMCIAKQAFPGQVEFMDHLTERCFAVDEDLNDLLVLIEELAPRFVGQDDKGNAVSGDELLKTLMARHCVNTNTIHTTEEGKRIRMRAIARSMITIFGATNLVIRMLRDGQLPAILRRWMMDHVGWGSDEVPLAAINNPLSTEDNTPEQIEFYHEMALTNALCLLVEKLIEVGVLANVDVNICSVHFSKFFTQVHRQCQVPKASDSIQQMLVRLCRQTCIRYAVHKVFFSETAAANIRCRPKPRADPSSDRPEDWIPARFDPESLLLVQPHLVVTEEMMVDVLTTARSTYMPTISWGVADVIGGIAKTMTDSYRKVTKRVLRYQQEEEAATAAVRASRKRKRTPTSAADNADSAITTAHTASEGGATATTSLMDCRDIVPDTPQSQQQHPSQGESRLRAAMEIVSEDLDAVCNDENYIAFRKQDFRAACDYFSQMSKGTIGSMVFEQVLLQWKKQWFCHRDRNRPQRDAAGVEVLGPNGERTYPHQIASPLVVIETVPEETGSGWGSGGGSSRRSRNRHDPRSYVQVCILAEYLEKDRHSDINDILRQCLSYRGARSRDIVSADGVRVTKPIHDTWGHPEGSSSSSSTSGTQVSQSVSRPEVVAHEYLGTISVEPRTDNLLYRVNHFAESDITDSLVFNRSLARGGKDARGFSNARNNTNRLHQIYFGGDLDKLFITEYWHQVGWEVKTDNYPWEYTKKLREMVRKGKDETGTPTSSSKLIKQHYPRDYVRPSTARQGQHSGAMEDGLHHSAFGEHATQRESEPIDLDCGDDSTRDGHESELEGEMENMDIVATSSTSGTSFADIPPEDQLSRYMLQHRQRTR